MANASVDLPSMVDFERMMQQYLEGHLTVMPVEPDASARGNRIRVTRPPVFTAMPPTEAEVASVNVPSGAPAGEVLNAIEEQRAMETARRALSEGKPAGPGRVRPMPDYQRDVAAYMTEFMRMGDFLSGSQWGHNLQPPEPRHTTRSDRVRMDVRLAERQIPEAMSAESKVFKDMIKRGLDKELLKALTATEGFGLVKEDWEVLRTSLIEMIHEQARLYFQSHFDQMDNRYDATVTFEIPKMTLSFRMPVNKEDLDRQRD